MFQMSNLELLWLPFVTHHFRVIKSQDSLVEDLSIFPVKSGRQTFCQAFGPDAHARNQTGDMAIAER